MKLTTNKLIRSFLIATLLFGLGISLPLSSKAQSLNCQWGRAGGSENLGSQFVATDNFGNVYIAGNFYDSTIVFGSNTLVNHKNLTYDIYVVKYNYLGDIIWAKNLGGKQNETISGIATDPSGNIFLTGYYQSVPLVLGIDTLTDTENIFTLKLNPSGNILWARSSAGGMCEVHSVTCDNAGNCYITGNYSGSQLVFGSYTLSNRPTYISCVFITKYTSGGAVDWAKNSTNDGSAGPGFTGCSYGYAYKIEVAPDGSIYIAGGFNTGKIIFGTDTLWTPPFSPANVYLLKMDNAGHFIWARTFGNSTDYPKPLLNIDQNSNPIITSQMQMADIILGTDTIVGNYGDLIMVKYDPAGNRLWRHKSVLSTYNTVSSSATDPVGNVFICGTYFNWLITFAGDTVYGNDTASLYLLKYDNDGNEVLIKHADSCNRDYANGLSIDPIGNVYLTGSFSGTKINIDGQTIPYVNNLYSSVYLAKFGNPTNACCQIPGTPQPIKIYPNPTGANSSVNIEFSRYTYSSINIYNTLGQKVFETMLDPNQNSLKINTDSMITGRYFIKLSGHDSSDIASLIIK